MTPLIYDEHFFEIEDQVEQLLNSLMNSQIFDSYLMKKQEVNQNQEVLEIRADFSQKKEAFNQISAYGNYAPDYREKQRSLRKAKRVLDLHPTVAEFRVAETDLQGILDEIGIKIARSISDEIKVETGNPFFESKSSCGGKCHAS